MLHTQLHGTHWQIGFQLGARSGPGRPFYPGRCSLSPSPPARLEFARTCLPLCPPVVPRRPGGAAGAGQGRGVPRTNWPGSSSPCTPCRPAPAAPALPCAGGEGPVRPEQRLSHGAGRAQRQLPIPFFRRRLFFCGQHHLLPPDGGRRQSVRTGGGTHLGAPQPTPPRAKCWSDPAAPAGILPGCSPGPGAAPAAPRLLLPHAGAGRPGWAYRPGRSVPRSAPRSIVPGRRTPSSAPSIPSTSPPWPPSAGRRTTTGGRKSAI